MTEFINEALISIPGNDTFLRHAISTDGQGFPVDALVNYLPDLSMGEDAMGLEARRQAEPHERFLGASGRILEVMCREDLISRVNPVVDYKYAGNMMVGLLRKHSLIRVLRVKDQRAA